MLRVEPAAHSTLGRVAPDHEEKNLASAREREAPVVTERAVRRVLLVVRVTSDLEVTLAQVVVVANDLGDLAQDFLTLCLELVLTRVEQNVARQLDDHAVVPHDDLETDLRQLVESRL